MERQRVLVVDDDFDLAENIAEIVGGALPVQVEIAGRLSEARARAAEERFDLILSDVRLPDGQGTDLIEPLRARWPFAEVVLITGDATVDSAIAAVRGGAFAYVLKPVSPEDLLEIVRRALGQVALATERERLRGELERSEKRHREVVEAVPALVLALDGGGRISLWNRRLEETTGFCRQEMIGEPGSALVGEGGVRPLLTKKGEQRLVRWETARVAPPGTRADAGWTYAVGTDVTAEQEMLRRTLRAERLAAVGTLAAGLAHEVRNPLNSAALQLQVLRRRVTKGESTPAALEEIVTIVEDEIRRLERLVNDFLSFARPRPLELQATALEDLCRAVLALVAPEAEAAQVELALAVAADLPSVQVDPERLRHVLYSLVRNGVEAMPSGGKLTIRARRAGDQIELDVEDSGEGFGEETPVFDALFTTKAKGTGLGLSIVHRIVTDHGGTMRVRSRPGETCFTISLPA